MTDTAAMVAEYVVTRCVNLRNRIALAHGGLVGATVKRMRHEGVETAGDAYDDGFIGLLQAVERFDPSRGLSLSTFAYKRIEGAIIDARRTRSSVKRTMLESGEPIPASYPLFDEDEWRLVTPDDTARRVDVADEIAVLLGSLSPRARLTLRLTIGAGLSREEAGRALGVTPWWVTQIKGEAMNELTGRAMRECVAA